MNIRVYVVDDSAIARRRITDILTQAGVEVIGSAADPLLAWPRLQAQWPDVIVLDVEMPRMDGLSFLRQLMTEHPIPVVMCSALTERGCQITLQAMAAGAAGVVTKPKGQSAHELQEYAQSLILNVRAAARTNLQALAATAQRRGPTTLGTTDAEIAALHAPRPASQHPSPPAQLATRFVAIGISTGGVQSIEAVLRRLHAQSPAIVLVQHMPMRFTASLAERLNHQYQMAVQEAKDGDLVINGRLLIAPGGMHMTVRRHGPHFAVEVRDGPAINHHKPSVDVLFKSVARYAGTHAAGLIMTGMGNDGARGLREMRDAGAYTAAQDEASSIVFGMPAEAIKLGAAEDVLPLDKIADWINTVVARPLKDKPKTPVS